MIRRAAPHPEGTGPSQRPALGQQGRKDSKWNDRDRDHPDSTIRIGWNVSGGKTTSITAIPSPAMMTGSTAPKN